MTTVGKKKKGEYVVDAFTVTAILNISVLTAPSSKGD